MSFSLVEVAGANFRTDDASDALNTTFMSRLGMRKRYLPARLAIARSLAVTSSPPPLADSDEPGKAIKGDTLFGTGTMLSCWLALIVQRSGEKDLDTKKLVPVVAAHWKRGLRLLDDEWHQADGDLTRFVRRLVDVAELPRSGGRTASGPKTPMPVSTGRLSLPIGEVSEETNSGQKVLWELNAAGGSPHSAVIGGVGSGKTRTAVAMLRSLREQTSVPLIAFDFKGDLGTDVMGGGYQIDQTFEADTVEPPRQPVPLNVMALFGSRDEFDVAQAAQRFRESFARLKGSRLGDRQRDALFTATENALSQNEPCALFNIRDELERIYEEREMREDGALATMREICRFPLFRAELSPDEFFERSWLIRLPPNVPEDSRTIVVNLILDALDQYLNSLPDAPTSDDGARGLRIACMVDEAHQILGTKLPALSSLVRMSRSKGGSVMLISQSPDDFTGEDDDFLSEMGLVAAFSTNAPPKNAARVLGKGANLTVLQTGQCLVKRREDQAAKKVQSWKPHA